MIHEEHAVMPHSGLLTEALQHLFYKQKTEKVIKVLIQETGACTHRGMAVEADMDVKYCGKPMTILFQMIKG